MERVATVDDIGQYDSFIWKSETVHIELPNGKVTELIRDYSYASKVFHGSEWFKDSVVRGYWSIVEAVATYWENTGETSKDSLETESEPVEGNELD